MITETLNQKLKSKHTQDTIRDSTDPVSIVDDDTSLYVDSVHEIGDCDESEAVLRPQGPVLALGPPGPLGGMSYHSSPQQQSPFLYSKHNRHAVRNVRISCPFPRHFSFCRPRLCWCFGCLSRLGSAEYRIWRIPLGFDQSEPRDWALITRGETINRQLSSE